jgi:hypothetical protein
MASRGTIAFQGVEEVSAMKKKQRPYTIADPRKHIPPATFTIPEGAPGAGGKVKGIVRERVFSDDHAGEWGTYCFFAELIEWPGSPGYLIRLGYYRRPPNKDRWGFAGQHTIAAPPAFLKQLISEIAKKEKWFRQPTS